ncbi:glycerophosphodiester phosphodiesterase family protein [Clostridium sediminicola]|uniref:glycerophosphodiester phosphodiesterase n=1 Tax=Clostridium sediminicola TaxID=3114879 RepID=UPI0031F1DE36
MYKFRNIAHRGASYAAPENTIAAIRTAQEMGADAIEIDVHLSKDGHVVVIHDLVLDRTTNGSGLVANYTLEELKELDAGIKFSKEFKGEKIPLLSEVFDFIKNSNMGILIELKGWANHYEGMEDKVVELINKYNFKDRAIVTSFQKDKILEIKKIDPSIKTGINFFFLGAKPELYVKKVKADAVYIPNFCFNKEKTKGKIKALKDSGYIVGTFTPDDKKAMMKVIKLGVDDILTNRPDMLNSLKKKKRISKIIKELIK